MNPTYIVPVPTYTLHNSIPLTQFQIVSTELNCVNQIKLRQFGVSIQTEFDISIMIVIKRSTISRYKK